MGVRMPRGPGPVAVLSWLVTAPVAAAVPVLWHIDPFGGAARLVPLVVGMLGVQTLAMLALDRRGPALSGLAAGLSASFTVLTLRIALHGTPYGGEGII